MQEEELRESFPIHWAVWEGDAEALATAIEAADGDGAVIDKVDVRGRTPLMLAVTLGKLNMARQLIAAGANADAQNKEYWSVSHEAIGSGSYAMLKDIIKQRDFQRSKKAAADMRSNLEKLRDSPDFYAEMSWEFTSWVPFVSKLCPSDTYKIYKRGSFLRIDTTLVGFEGHSWQRGKQSFVFRLLEEEGKEPTPQIIVIDHEAETASIQTLTADETLQDFDPPEEALHYRMTSPVSTTFIDVERIGFERSKGSGLFSWMGNGEGKERIGSYDCKVFNASNVNLVTKTRTDHLTEEHKARFKQEESSHPLSSILNMVRSEISSDEGNSASSTRPVDGGFSPAQYLDADYQLPHDIGKPKQGSQKSNSFKATLWLAENYPLSLLDQVAPIVNLMSSSSAHFARLNTFMRLQLPAGFPVKIEIPLFHLVSARITFGRINEPGPGVTPITEPTTLDNVAMMDGVPLLNTGAGTNSVEIEERMFDIPSEYCTMDDRAQLWWPEDTGEGGSSRATPRYGHNRSAHEQEEMLLQLAIAESLKESRDETSTTSTPPMQRIPRPTFLSFAEPNSVSEMVDRLPGYDSDEEDRQMAIAIQRSLQDSHGAESSSSRPETVEESSSHSYQRTNTPIDENRIAARGHETMEDAEMEMINRALRMSMEEEERGRQRREKELREQQEREEEELRQVLEMSLHDK